ncbi:MAG: glycoside hydrolase family 65 protein [Flammeovirgaceae bacterium]|nr:glycoside hydrolase family 65 protein [Flammeovirgaceae bacterium]
MKDYLKRDEWQIIEEGFHPEHNRITESIFSLGNGRMGQRANFEEEYSGDTHLGSYIAGVYYPDKTRVGWWKNGYPEYFAKVLNAPSWIGIHIYIDDEPLDLAQCKVEKFVRLLNMKEGFLQRSCMITMHDGRQLTIHSKRFCSLSDAEVGAIRYAITPINFSGDIEVMFPVDVDVKNRDANYDEKFWEEITRKITPGHVIITAETRKTFFHVCTAIAWSVYQDGTALTLKPETVQRKKWAAHKITFSVEQGKETVIYKYATVLSSLNYPKDQLIQFAEVKVDGIKKMGFELLLKNHSQVWTNKWLESDITIEGDVAAQQGIRFNIFQLHQTYTGDDERFNIGPKGFTGEKYGGSTYWDTEAYCLPFYLGTAEQRVPRNLLMYRYKHLQKAIENAEKLGFKNGAALYPMVTMNGEECHNEWEITFEEIHRNGAIAYAIYDYVRYTGDKDYLLEYGLDVLIAISRFWAQRVNYSEDKKKYVILGVTGPNEYENNVNNNWYTNYLAKWTLTYTLESLHYMKDQDEKRFAHLVNQLHFKKEEEQHWNDIIANLYFPEDEKRNVFLQQDGFLDKELITVSQLSPGNRPINQKWSWDRILRSCFIKQADVLQGLYFFEEHFDEATHKRNFDFYEPMTVHESSLSPCVHVILASKLGYREKAYELYLRTSRLDIDDYNNDTEDGCHITSMAGTWMAIVKGFGGMRVKDDTLHFNPFIPAQWDSYSFKVEFRRRVIKVRIAKGKIEATLQSGEPLTIVVAGKQKKLQPSELLSEVL